MTHARAPHVAWRRRLGALASVVWPFALILLLWQGWIAIGNVPAIVAPAPAEAAASAWRQLPGTLPDLAATLAVIAAGLVLGMGFGVGLASLTWFSPLLSGLMTPVTVLLNAIPSVALIPVVASIFGFNDVTVVVVAALITFFPAFVMTRSGLDSLPPGAADLMGVLGAPRWRRYLRVALPAAVPNIVTALRIGAMLSVLGALTAEWLLGTRGLGYRLALAQQTRATEDAWTFSILGVLLSLLIFGLATLLERRVSARFR